jgi:hypothetical protein
VHAQRLGGHADGAGAGHAFLGLDPPEHDQGGAQPELGVADARPGGRGGEDLREAEDGAEEADGLAGVLVAQDREMVCMGALYSRGGGRPRT